MNINETVRVVGIGTERSSTGAESIALEVNSDLPMLVDRAVMLSKRGQRLSATNHALSPTLEEKIERIERFIA